MEQLTYAAEYDADQSVLTVRGEIDEGAGVQLRAAIAEYSADYTRDLAVDLSRVDYFPSLAVGVLAQARLTASRSPMELELRAADGCIAQRVLDVCGIPYTRV